MWELAMHVWVVGEGEGWGIWHMQIKVANQLHVSWKKLKFITHWLYQR